jgi:hypothetical protein
MILTALEVSNDGQPGEIGRIGVATLGDAGSVGTGFSVDRVTGRIAGNPAFDTGLGKSVVISRGDRNQSFVVYGETGYRRNYIEVREFTMSEAKPFTTMDYGAVYMGTCR